MTPEDFWSEWPGLNRRPPAPKAGALPTGLHPVMKLLQYHSTEKVKSKLWSVSMGVHVVMRGFSEGESGSEIPLSPVFQEA